MSSRHAQNTSLFGAIPSFASAYREQFPTAKQQNRAYDAGLNSLLPNTSSIPRKIRLFSNCSLDFRLVSGMLTPWDMYHKREHSRVAKKEKNIRENIILYQFFDAVFFLRNLCTISHRKKTFILKRLLYLNHAASSFDFGFDILSFFFGDAFFNICRSAIHKRFCFFQA